MIDETKEENYEEEEIEHDQYLVFSVKSQEFGFQARRVKEITSTLEISNVPNSPVFVEGIMNLRGRLVSVINFRKRFGFEHKEQDEDTRIVILEKEDFPVGIIVDSVEEVIKIVDEMVQKLPDTAKISVSQEYISGIGMLDGRIILLLNVDSVLSGSELAELGEMTKIMGEAVVEKKKTEDSSEKNNSTGDVEK